MQGGKFSESKLWLDSKKQPPATITSYMLDYHFVPFSDDLAKSGYSHSYNTCTLSTDQKYNTVKLATWSLRSIMRMPV